MKFTHYTNVRPTPTQPDAVRSIPREELTEDQLEKVAGGFLDATGTGSSVLGDGIFCVGGGLINSKMEVNL